MSSRRTPRRGRRARVTLDDDLPLSLLCMIRSQLKRSRSKRKTTPRKKVASTSKAAALPTPPTPDEIVTIDDGPESEAMLNNINEKIGNFMQTGSFISSDEDETEMIKAKSNKKTSAIPFFISDDSDDDCSVVRACGTKSNVDNCEPSTSAGTSSDLSILKAIDEMALLPSGFDCNKSANTQSPLKDMKSLEDFRKETEEMLKNASSLLDEIKTGRKAEPEPKLEESPSKVTVGACPICLESLATRAASVTVCGHIFCKECISHTAKTLKKCPTCRKSITLKKIHPIYF